MTEHTSDMLPEFHMQHPDDAVYALIAHLVVVLETYDNEDIATAYRNVANILGETEATRILHVMCQVMHVDYLELMQECQAITSRHLSPRLLLHMAVLPVPYVAEQLEVDQYWAAQLLDQFRKHFTIDPPILWLKSFLNITEQERLRYSKEKEDLLMGRAITGTPKDTAEYRRATQYHHKRHELKPPGAPD
ncbi:MAG TPA: hypothetical protein VLG38_03275 [Gammaproteobacteria bacterium]|nr:hypothetical protein [Gammaproteobacteria bacterium]